MVIRFFIRKQKIVNNHMSKKHKQTALDFCDRITLLIMRTLHSHLNCDRFAYVRRSITESCFSRASITYICHLLDFIVIVSVHLELHYLHWSKVVITFQLISTVGIRMIMVEHFTISKWCIVRIYHSLYLSANIYYYF